MRMNSTQTEPCFHFNSFCCLFRQITWSQKNHPVCNQQLSLEYCHSFLWKCCPSTWKIILKCIFQVAGVIGITWISPTNIQTDDVYFDLVQTLTTLFSVTQIWEKLISDYRRSNLTCWHWPLNFSFSLKN